MGKGRKLPVVHSVSIAEFDVDVGNTLSVRHPDFSLKIDRQDIANLCIPDGGHLHDEDWTFLLLEDEEGGGVESGAFLYGMAYFHTVRDEKTRRGAHQKSLLLLSRQPYFHLFEPVLRTTMREYMDKSNKDAVKDLYRTLDKNINQNPQYMQLTQLQVMGEKIPVDLWELQEDTFGGVSLTDLCATFRTDTMILWYAALLQQRILFVGKTAHLVGNCVLATPLLVAPLKGFTKVMFPYISLYDLKPIQQRTYIGGTTNTLFESKSEWYDVIASFTSGSITSQTSIKLTSQDRRLINSVLSGIEDKQGEKWVRDQFKRYTERSLSKIEQGRPASKSLLNVKESPSFKNWVMQKQHSEYENVKEFFEQLKSETTNLSKFLFKLEQNLTNVGDIEEICDADGIAVVARSLSAESAQERKYAVSVLAKLALSIKGQIAILTESVLSQVLKLVEDPMMNVANAACTCLVKISMLSIGVNALLTRDVVPLMGGIINAPDLDLLMRTKAAQVLLQIYTFKPGAPKLPVEPFRRSLDTPDERFASILLNLLNVWGETVPKPKNLSLSMKLHLEALQDEDAETREKALESLLEDISRSKSATLEFVLAGGVEIVLFLDKLKEHALSFAVFAIVADTHTGRLQLGRPNVNMIARATDALANYNHHSSEYLLSAARFVEVVCQHAETAVPFLDRKGLGVLKTFILHFHNEPDVYVLCSPALGAVKNLVRTLPAKRQAIREAVYELQSLFFPVHPSASQEDTLVQEGLNVTLQVIQIQLEEDEGLCESLVKVKLSTMEQYAAFEPGSKRPSITILGSAPTDGLWSVVSTRHDSEDRWIVNRLYQPKGGRRSSRESPVPSTSSGRLHPGSGGSVLNTVEEVEFPPPSVPPPALPSVPPPALPSVAPPPIPSSQSHPLIPGVPPPPRKAPSRLSTSAEGQDIAPPLAPPPPLPKM